MKELYTENYKTLLKEIKETSINGNTSYNPWIGRLTMLNC